MKKGFSLIEILIAIGIISIISVIVIYSFGKTGSATNLNTEAEKLSSILQEARSKAVASLEDSKHGIYFSTSSYIYFKGSDYNAGASSNIKYSLPTGMKLEDTDSDKKTIFDKLSGASNENATITLMFEKGSTSSISVIIDSLGNINVVK